MMLFGHVKGDLVPLNNTHCLLKTPAHFRRVVVDAKEDGVYGFWDTNKCIWIRIGMVAGRPISYRGKEHKDCATKQGTDSQFYQLYPSKDAPTVYHSGRRGFFESLESYVAVSLPLQSSINPLVSLFDVSGTMKDNIKRINFKAKDGESQTMEFKFRRFFYYSGKLAYGLCVPFTDNVSTNPGMEPIIGYYGKK